MFNRGCDLGVIILVAGRRIQGYEECIYLEGVPWS